MLDTRRKLIVKKPWFLTARGFHMKFCDKCKKYTLKSACSCGKKTVDKKYKFKLKWFK